MRLLLLLGGLLTIKLLTQTTVQTTADQWVNYPFYRFFFSLNDSAKLAVGLGLLALLVISSWLIYNTLKHKIFHNSANQPFKHWLSILFIAIKKPIQVLGVSYAIYLLLTLGLPLFFSHKQAYTVNAYAYYALILLGLATGLWFILRLLRLVSNELLKITHHTQNKAMAIIAHFLSRYLKYIIALIILNIIIPMLPIESNIHYYLLKLMQLLFIGIISWICLELVNAFEKTILTRYQITHRDNLAARKVYTQTKVFKKLITLLVLLFTTAAVLLTFDSVRQYGTSLLASAGLITAIAGFAAQRSISGIIAGLQIAISQPIRIDDAVMVENEFGFIEEITLTYVVIRLWDWRRLIVPINYFIEKPFQNWSRHSTNLIGAVFLYVDYTLPVDKLREELKRVLVESPLWDGKVSVIHVSDTKTDTMELRILASATSAPNTWDLRCEVREKLIAYIQKNYPDCLPKLRTTPLTIKQDSAGH